MGFFDILRKKERSISYNTKQSPISNALKLAKSMNTDYIEIPHEICVCENCAPYINRVYCISGKDNRFPKLPNFILENGGLHCNVIFNAYFYFDGNKLDHYVFSKDGKFKIVEKNAIKHSNRPFVDDRSAYEKQNYINWLNKKAK